MLSARLARQYQSLSKAAPKIINIIKDFLGLFQIYLQLKLGRHALVISWIISLMVLQLNIAFLKAFDSIVGLSTDGDVKLHEVII